MGLIDAAMEDLVNVRKLDGCDFLNFMQFLFEFYAFDVFLFDEIFLHDVDVGCWCHIQLEKIR